MVHMGQLDGMRVRKSEGSLSLTKIDFGMKVISEPSPSPPVFGLTNNLLPRHEPLLNLLSFNSAIPKSN